MRTIVTAIVALLITVGSAAALAQSTESAAGSERPSTDRPSDDKARQVLEQMRPLAEQGDASAQYNMGVLYDQGYGVPQSYDTARQWYQEAAAQGNAKAAHNLGIMYESGKGVEADPKKAARWFKQAADGDEPAAQNNLAVLYVRGEGVPRDMGLAAYWAAQAAAGGNQSAIDNLPEIISDLPHSHVNGNDVNVRSGPSKKDKIVTRAGSATELVKIKHQDDWTQVLFPRDYQIGWIANALLADSQAPLAASAPGGASTPGTDKPEAAAAKKTETQTAGASDDKASSASRKTSPRVAGAGKTDKNKNDKTSSSGKRAVGVSAANIRDKPDSSASVMYQAHRGDVLTVLRRQKGWRYVESDDGRRGWVAGFLLTGMPD